MGSCVSKRGSIIDTPAASTRHHRAPQEASCSSSSSIIQVVHDGVIGHNTLIESPYGGQRMLLYADYTASGRALDFIETYMMDEVLPMYGNTHSENSAVAAQMSAYVHDARDAVLESVHGDEEVDAVIFVGSGSTGAINKMARVLGLQPEMGAFQSKKHEFEQHGLDQTYDTVVFISLMEHHSNILPWRETDAHVVAIDFDETGVPDVGQLEAQLEAYKGRARRLIGSFSAGSNITGRRVDVEGMTKVLHKHGALAMWDYAAAAPYIDIHMGDKDAIFISTHKFVGGPGTPGVLVAKKRLFARDVCVDPGGGTVVVVSARDHAYVAAPEDREAGGTPDIVGIIRAGLVYRLKSAVGGTVIEGIEDSLAEYTRAKLAAMPNVVVVGMSPEAQLPIFSLLIQVPLPNNPDAPPMYLHYNFVVKLLSDLFGIQMRGGCACAGPYGFYLLNAAHDSLLDGEEVIFAAFRDNDELHVCKPGFVRFNVAWFLNREEIDFILDAVHFVSTYGYRFLPLYEFDSVGNWQYSELRGVSAAAPRISLKRLHEVSFGPAGMTHAHAQPSRWAAPDLDIERYREAQIDFALALAKKLPKTAHPISPERHPSYRSEYRWFLTPSDGTALLAGRPIPFHPPVTLSPRVGFDSAAVASSPHFCRSFSDSTPTLVAADTLMGAVAPRPSRRPSNRRSSRRSPNTKRSGRRPRPAADSGDDALDSVVP